MTGKAILIAGVALVAAATALAGIDRGRVVFGQGAAGVTVGMPKAQVVAKLGAPNPEISGGGFLSYGKGNATFDVYLDRAGGKVVTLGITGPRFCTAGGICIGDRMSEVFATYGDRVKRHVAPDEQSYKLIGNFAGKPTYTVFMIKNGVFSARTRIVQIFIGACAGTTYCRK